MIDVHSITSPWEAANFHFLIYYIVWNCANAHLFRFIQFGYIAVGIFPPMIKHCRFPGLAHIFRYRQIFSTYIILRPNSVYNVVSLSMCRGFSTFSAGLASGLYVMWSSSHDSWLLCRVQWPGAALLKFAVMSLLRVRNQLLWVATCAYA